MSNSMAALLGALIGGLFSGVISPWIASRLRANERQLDLYKAVYPVKIQAAAEIMAKAEELINALIDWLVALSRRTPSLPLEFPEEIERLSRELEVLGGSARWILGDGVALASQDLCGAASDAIRSGLQAMGAASADSAARQHIHDCDGPLRLLGASLRAATHLRTCDVLLPRDARLDG